MRPGREPQEREPQLQRPKGIGVERERQEMRSQRWAGSSGMGPSRGAIASILRAIGTLLGGRAQGGGSREREASNRVIRPWRADSLRAHPSVGLTPSKALALLHAADSGSPEIQYELFSEMLQKWPRLTAVEATRRLGLTGLGWDVASGATGIGDRARQRLADETAEYCRVVLSELERFGETLEHLSSAIGFGLAVAELVWEAGRLIDIVPVPHARLMSDPNEPWRLRVRTEEEPSLGIALDDQPGKWLIHQPRGLPGRPFEGGLLRASVLLYLAQNLSLKDWLIYSQVAGMPVRVAQFDPGIPEGEKQSLLKMLEALGTDAVAALSKGIELKLIESRGGERPYEPLQRYCNTEITILWLGQHLTTDILTSGSRAAAEVHDRVREDLLAADIADEARSLQRGLLRPLVQARFGDAAPVPRFRRALVESVDTRSLADTLAVAVRELGVRVPRRWVHRVLGIPEPLAGEAVLDGQSPTGAA